MVPLPASTLSFEEALFARVRQLLDFARWLVLFMMVATIAIDVLSGHGSALQLGLRIAEFVGALALIEIVRRRRRHWRLALTVVGVWWALLDSIANATWMDPTTAVTSTALLLVGFGLIPDSWRSSLGRLGATCLMAAAGLVVSGIHEPPSLILLPAVAAIGLVLSRVQYAGVRQAWALREQAVLAGRQAEEAADARARFLAGVSHEMRTPLNSLANMLEMVRERPLEDGQHEALAAAVYSARLLEVLVDDALKLVEFDKTGIEACAEPVDLLPLLRQMTSLLGGQVTLCVQSAPPGRVRIDAQRLHQLLGRLMPPGRPDSAAPSPTLDLSVSWAEHQLTLGIAGVGCEGQRVREGLQRETTEVLLRSLGGTMSRDDGPDGRGHLELRLPAALEPTAVTGPDAATGPLAGIVLVVDDNPLNRMVLVRMLERLGLDVDQAVDGLQAVEMLDRRTYALVLMDLDMPVLDGFGATEAARARGVSAPIVAVTASATSDTPARVSACGMDGLMVKPVKLIELEEVVRDALARALPRVGLG